ncbi:hypothetical protein LOTGIDRAFT_108770 [Lottia gigantea]|uniref:Uncharacterized protein n=1 Tax=Lottia gigantea TaxID=225164 RepID=V3ZKH6_LOTGI|nr:hypothetical protein LOTGIDRAFT_108770 [Lottia gigantea]ESO82885.1 hypothetical protein LOTGIDRAFT_108770 [Lottia gigantea]
MADGLNPFEEDLIENEFEGTETPTEDNQQLQSEKKEAPDISWDSIAAKLLGDNYILTALELHTELVETGRELPRLRDYFSNPGNFERTKDDSPSPTLPRTSSVQTFDSLDFARYSDDGERQVDERVAVLEFELRKAHETIRSLRATLTREAEKEMVTPEFTDTSQGMATDDVMRPMENRALNFLVNEYLLLNNYKLTAVTFSEENEEQDFEDWDDVGLNVSRPPDLLSLFRDFGNHIIPSKETRDFGCETDMVDEHLEEMEVDLTNCKLQLEQRINDLEDELQMLLQERDILAEQVKILKINIPLHSMPAPPKSNRSESVTSSTSFTNISETPTMTDSEASYQPITDSETNSPGSDINEDVTIVTNGNMEDSLRLDDEIKTDVVDAEGSGNKQQYKDQDKTLVDTSSSFCKALREVAFHVSNDNRITQEVCKINNIDDEGVIRLLARCLPHIVPNVLLAKREELIPVIICTAMLHTDSKERDNLLNILFNLIKKPDDEQRQMILTGCIAFAETVGPTRLETELLPQCWEQISHKYVERRLLVAEACGALSSYLTAEIRSSLLLSMLTQMLEEDKDEDVREAVVRSLGLLLGFICDNDKYIQGFELLKKSFKDGSEKVLTACLHVFLPSFASWSYELGKLEHHLLHSILRELEEIRSSTCTNIPLDEHRFLLLVSQLQELVPFLFLSVLESGPFLKKLKTQKHIEPDEDDRFPVSSCKLTDINIIIGDKQYLYHLLSLYEDYISEEWYEPWDQLNWVVNNFIPRLLDITEGIGLSFHKVISALSRLIHRICRTFGETFTRTKVKPKFEELVSLPDDILDYQVNLGHTALTSCIIPVYSVGVLSLFHSEKDKEYLSQFLKKVLFTLSFCRGSLDGLKSAFTELSLKESNHELLLVVLWDGVVHSSPLVRASAASMFELLIKGIDDILISTRVVPALVTLANDPETAVRISTIPSIGAILENNTNRSVLDRVYMQLQTFFDDPMYRDQHDMQVELIRTLAGVGANTEPKFREEFLLPRLAGMALANNNTSNDTKRRDIAMQLFEAYSAMSCCFINDQLILEAMLPGLRCLKQDMALIAPEHEEVVVSMIKEYETKMDASRSVER